MYLETTIAPSVEPILLADAKAHLRVTSSAEDTLITALISAARAHVEAYTHRRLLTQTLVAHGDDFGDCYNLSIMPVQSVSGITYRAIDSTILTVDPTIYRAVLNREPPLVTPNWGEVWPITQPGPDAVQVTMVVGYGAAPDVPPAFRAAILLLTGHLYANREATIDTGLAEMPLGIAALLQPHVFWV